MVFTERDFRDALWDCAQKYRKEANECLRRSSHMNENVMKGRDDLEQEVIDALLTDFINYIGLQRGGDYGFYTKDLKGPPKVIYL